MVNLDRLGVLWNMAHGSSEDPADVEISDLLFAAASELAERRREPVTQGPGAEERRLYWLGVFAPLVWVRANAGTSHADVATMIASMTDAMLAAERAPTYPDGRKP